MEMQTPSTLTVRDLLARLAAVHPDTPVQICMNGEYQWEASSVTYVKNGGRRGTYLLISDEAQM